MSVAAGSQESSGRLCPIHQNLKQSRIMVEKTVAHKVVVVSGAGMLSISLAVRHTPHASLIRLPLPPLADSDGCSRTSTVEK